MFLVLFFRSYVIILFQFSLVLFFRGYIITVFQLTLYTSNIGVDLESCIHIIYFLKSELMA